MFHNLLQIGKYPHLPYVALGGCLGASSFAPASANLLALFLPAMVHSTGTSGIMQRNFSVHYAEKFN